MTSFIKMYGFSETSKDDNNLSDNTKKSEIQNKLNKEEVNMQSYISLTDKKILSIQIVDQKEEMVDLKNQSIISYGSSPEIPDNKDYTKIRKMVYEKLCLAQTYLPKNLFFCIYEGYRSIKLQEYLFNKRFKKIKNLHPSWLDNQIFKETIKMVSPVINQDGSQNIPPHSTGGAMDIYLVDVHGNPVDMGIHPKDWMLDENGSLSKTDSAIISSEAQKYRKIMIDALTKVGFINYNMEYWHWSYGDRYWAYHKQENNALYGTVDGSSSRNSSNYGN
jgi:D-alanyl-D-alanine dipeptidase